MQMRAVTDDDTGMKTDTWQRWFKKEKTWRIVPVYTVENDPARIWGSITAADVNPQLNFFLPDSIK